VSKRRKRGRTVKPAADPDGLTPVQRLFVLEYQIDRKAGPAYMRSHPTCKSSNAACVAGWHLLRNSKVSAAVEKWRQTQYKRIQMQADEALAVISRNARADIADAYDDEGLLLPVAMWPEDLRRSVRSIDPATGKVQLYDGQRAAELMAQAGGKLKPTLSLEFDHLAYLGAKPPEPPAESEG
jgi:hypothetical protein